MAERHRARPALKRARDGTIYHLAKLLLAIGGVIPDRLGAGLGSLLGRLTARLNGRDRERALANLRQAYADRMDELDIRRTMRACFRHMGIILFELPRIPRMVSHDLDRHVMIENVDLLRAAVESKRGVVIATGHIGNWEVMGAAAAQLGLPLNVIARRLNDPRLNDLVIALRGRSGVKTILRESPESARQILGCLRRGEMLALLIDQDIQAEGVFVPFFGRPAYTPIGAAALAARTGALFVAAATHRLAPGRHAVSLRVVDIPDTSEHGIIEATRIATSHLEEWIRQRPEQWAWIHDRWKTKEN